MWRSPFQRWPMSHARPITRKTNPVPMTRNPRTYQSPDKTTSLGGASSADPARGRGGLGCLGRAQSYSSPTGGAVPGPTSVWPPRRIGIRAAAAEAVIERSHGSPTASARSRSLAKRSSATGQPDSSGPSRSARRTRESMRAASASSPTIAASAPGPWAARRRPRVARGGRGRAGGRDLLPGISRAEGERRSGAHAPLFGEEPDPARHVPLQPGHGARRASAEDQQLAPRVRRDGAELLEAGDGQAGSVPRSRSGRGSRCPRGQEDSQVQRRVEVEGEPVAAGQLGHREPRRLVEPARKRVVSRQRRKIRAGACASDTAQTSEEYRLFVRARHGPCGLPRPPGAARRPPAAARPPRCRGRPGRGRAPPRRRRPGRGPRNRATASRPWPLCRSRDDEDAVRARPAEERRLVLDEEPRASARRRDRADRTARRAVEDDEGDWSHGAARVYPAPRDS